jgi:hypothetical protein
MALSELLDRLREKRASSHHQQISEDDVRRAVGKLQVGNQRAFLSKKKEAHFNPRSPSLLN